MENLTIVYDATGEIMAIFKDRPIPPTGVPYIIVEVPVGLNIKAVNPETGELILEEDEDPIDVVLRTITDMNGRITRDMTNVQIALTEIYEELIMFEE